MHCHRSSVQTVGKVTEFAIIITMRLILITEIRDFELQYVVSGEYLWNTAKQDG